MKRYGAFFFVASLLLSCAAPRPAYLAHPQAIVADGVYMHAASAMMFPPSAGDCRRTSIVQFDVAGNDVSAGYECAPVRTMATVYVYPARPVASAGSPPELVALTQALAENQEFEVRKQEILRAHPDARLLDEHNVDAPVPDAPLFGGFALFELEDTFGGQRQKLHSEIDLFSYARGDWVVKYRFTYPAGDRPGRAPRPRRAVKRS